MHTIIKRHFRQCSGSNWGAGVPTFKSPLRFRESAAASEIFARTWSWLRDNSSRKDFYFRQHAANVFGAMFGGSKTDLVSFF
jgi:hypothetical protein